MTEWNQINGTKNQIVSENIKNSCCHIFRV